MSFKKCCKNTGKTFFTDVTKNDFWKIGESETILFEKKVKICEKTNISIESTIAAELATGAGAEVNAFNSYKLYINGIEVCRAGYEAEGSNPGLSGPNLETSSLTWAGLQYKTFIVKITAQLFSSPINNNTTATSNVSKNRGLFLDAKGAFLRINLLPKSTKTYFFVNENSSWTNGSPVTLFDETIKLDPCTKSKISVFGSIAAQISGSGFNTYKLLINEEEVARGGFESETDPFGPDIQTSSLIWSSSTKKSEETNIKILAETTASSNVDTSIPAFNQAKGAFLSIVVDSCKNSLNFFSNEPVTKAWKISDGEIILFEEQVEVNENIQVTSSIAAFLSRENLNIYRLYINGEQVGKSGYESGVTAPMLETSSLIWGSSLKDLYDCTECKNPRINIKVTAETIDVGDPQDESNVDNDIEPFKGAKGAFLSVFSYND